MSTLSVRNRPSSGLWWMLSPLALVAVVTVVVGVGLMGAITGPATSDAATQEADAANGSCTVIPDAAAVIGSPDPTATSAGPAATDPANVAGVRLDAGQLQNAQTIVAVGKTVGAPVKAMAIALTVAYQDTRLDATASSAGGIGLGLFLQTSTTYPAVDRLDPAAAASAFYRRMLTLDAYTAGLDLSQVAISMQGNTGSTVQDYQAQAGWATALAALLNDGTPTATGGFGVDCVGGAGDNTAFVAGNIISDQVFYDVDSMTAGQVRAFIDLQNQACPDSNRWCLKNLKLTTPAEPADRYCAAYPGGAGQDPATVIAAVSVACGINPQVLLTTLQKESQGLTRTDPTQASWAAAWGWHCPDNGPAGTAACDPGAGGFFPQAYGTAKQFAQYRHDPQRYQYRAGETVDILWNVAASGCGGAPVTIANVATASLYDYTPYQPNPASLSAYPGVGDRCSSYGNRNFFYLFRQYFGPTGGGSPIPNPAAVGGTVGGPISMNGTTVTLPAKAGITGTITAPTPTVGKAIAAGLAWLGEPYSWGGGTAAGPTVGICGPDGAENDCHVVGFDCSGLMLYLWAQVGIPLTHFSHDQWAAGTKVPYSQALPGDMIGYPGHIALYLGRIGGTPYMLEAPESGEYVHVTPVRNTATDPHYAAVSRVWAGR